MRDRQLEYILAEVKLALGDRCILDGVRGLAPLLCTPLPGADEDAKLLLCAALLLAPLEVLALWEEDEMCVGLSTLLRLDTWRCGTRDAAGSR